MTETIDKRSRERRFTERFRIHDGLIYYRELRKLNWFNSFHGPCVLSDIASNSASFACPYDLTIKKQVELKITSSGSQKEISVKGHITRKTSKTKTGEFIYVVQFSPFGQGYMYNSHMSREQMREFIKTVQTKNGV